MGGYVALSLVSWSLWASVCSPPFFFGGGLGLFWGFFRCLAVFCDLFGVVLVLNGYCFTRGVDRGVFGGFSGFVSLFGVDLRV